MPSWLRSIPAAVLVAFIPLSPAASAQQTAPPPTRPPQAQAAQPKPAAPPLFRGMGTHTRKASTDSPEAQRYFDQALVWTFSFNHDEAIRSFAHAAELDPDFAMAHWGIAFCNGPHINNPIMDEPHSRAAWDALQKAQALKANADPAERALIDALAARYADPAKGELPLTPEDRAPLDRAYAAAMKRVYAAHPDDPDIATLYAESLMDLRPWDLWDVTSGEPRPETPEVLAALEHALELDPDHPGANHLYIHAIEASPTPEKANAAADRLRTLVPASGHMVHMPAHIDVRTGRWSQAAEQNRRALKIDAAYREISPRQGLYRLYMAHNDHFLAYACMMLGRSQEAISAANAMVSKVPPEFLAENAALVDAYAPIGMEVLVRFGRWDDILAHPQPPASLPITTALWRFARATAHAAKGDLKDAEAEQAEFRRAMAAVPDGAMMAVNPAETILGIADLTLAGEIAFRRGQIDDAVIALTEAVKIEDSLKYMEPPDWVQPVRHSLGAVLLAADRPEEAEKVYRADLEQWPENGWALFGLARALKAQNSPEAAKAQARFDKAWADADTEIHATCLCIPAAD